MKWTVLLLVLACAHEPKLPPPDSDEARDAAEELQKQHDYFEQYVTSRRRDCTRRCTLASNVCSKARRICSIAEGSPRQEDTLAPYCQVAQNRCEKVDKRLRSEYCDCWNTGPRIE